MGIITEIATGNRCNDFGDVLIFVSHCARSVAILFFTLTERISFLVYQNL